MAAGPHQLVTDPTTDREVANKKHVADEIAAALASFEPAMPMGYIYGIDVRVFSSTFSIDRGRCRDGSNRYDMLKTGSHTIDINATGVGGLDTGAKEDGRWYYAFVIHGDSVGSPHVMVSANPFSPTLPTGYTRYRRVGSGLLRSGNNWMSAHQELFNAPIPLDGQANSSGGIGNPRWVFWSDDLADKQVLTGGAETVDTPIDLSAVVPTDAIGHMVQADIRATGQDAIIMRGGVERMRVLAGQQAIVNLEGGPGNFTPTIPPRLWYKNAAPGGSTDIFIYGYQEIL